MTLHFRIIIYLLNNQINYFIYSIRYFSVSVQYSTGTPFRYCVGGGGGGGGGVKGEVASGSAPPVWI